MKKFQFWGLLAINGNNASGLLPYLIARRNYPVINASKEYQTELKQIIWYSRNVTVIMDNEKIPIR